MSIAGNSFSQIVTNMVAAAKSAVSVALDFTTGSINLALVQSVAGVALWLQGLILQVLLQSRASTSQGADLDSWCADFAFPRRAAVAASGQLTFSRFQPSAATVIPVGAIVATAVGGAQFAVRADPTSGLYGAAAAGPGLAGYTLAPGVASGTVPAAAIVSGAAGNVTAGAISLLMQAINGIDTVSNALPFAGGADAEADAAFRLRFQNFINTLMKGTDAALGFALTALQPGLSVAILDNTKPDLTAQNGFVTIVLDDGSGAPPGTLLQAAAAAVEAVRCTGITIGVIPPSILSATIAMTVVSTVASQHAQDVAAATAALQLYIAALPVGAPLPYARLAQLAFDASPNIANVTGATLNAGTADLTASAVQVIKPGTIAVS
jgi:uncharacterized phage protein gp47/JayE